jgi:glyoxylase-like metal-dependent hydrolase (beta-lactamase superfamily II)
MKTYEDAPLSITKFDSLGPYGNNAYLVVDRAGNEAVIIDMPAGSKAVIDAARGLNISAILLT